MRFCRRKRSKPQAGDAIAETGTSRANSLIRVAATLLIRGAGSGVSVLLTVLVARYLDPSAAAKFFLLFNITTIAAICFRWGLDDVIVRRVASQPAPAEARATSARLQTMAHRRVAIWVAASLAGAVIATLTSIYTTPRVTLLELFTAVAISALISLAACGGRAYQGIGRNNLAAFVLNILVPGAALVGFLLIFLTQPNADANELLAIYGGASLLSYTAVIWLFPVARPRLRIWREIRPDQALVKQDRSAANRLGGVVLSQQALNWGALLMVPVAYGASIYPSFMVNFKVASLISLVMLAVNFTFAPRLARQFSLGELTGVRSLTRLMIVTVLSSSVALAVLVILLRDTVYAFSDVEPRLDVLLMVLTGGQVLFATSAVYSLVLAMCHQESFLLYAQGALTLAGLALFIVLSFVAPIEVACSVFVFTYGALALVLWRRVSRVLASRET